MAGPAERILIIRHGAFGDIVQSDGAFRDIRAHHPHARITVLTTPAFRKLLERCPHIDAVMIDERPPPWRVGRMVAIVRALRSAAFTHVYDLQSSDRTGLYRRLVLPRAIWCARDRRTIAMIGRRRPTKPGLHRYVEILASTGVPAHHALEPDVSWMADDVSDHLRLAGVTDPYVALIPGCSARHPAKRWPGYAALASALIERGLDVVTAPGPDELDLCRSISGAMLTKDPPGYLNWFELAGVLRGAAFVVGNDTGPSHVASCLGRPGLALFGPHTSVERTGIRRGPFDAIEVPDLAELSVDRVLDEVLTRLRALGHVVDEGAE